MRENALFDLHVHTKYCDGEGTPDEIVRAAIGKGLEAIGFSGHSYTAFDEEVCMTRKGTDRYEEKVRQAAKDYADKIKVFCGIEQDYYSEEPTDRWDYVIGSVHYVRVRNANGEPAYPSVDETPQLFEEAVEKYFGGDVYAFTEAYYDVLSDVVRKTGADIIGHFDLITKFNAGGENGGKGRFFDEGHPRYVAAWQKAADKLLETGAVFEINFGGMNRGSRMEPYPSRPIIDYLDARGGKFILSSDSHNASTLACWNR